MVDKIAFVTRHFRTANAPSGGYRSFCGILLKGLSHEIDFKNVDENGQILALTRAAAGF